MTSNLEVLNNDLVISSDVSVNNFFTALTGGHNLSGFCGEIRLWTTSTPPHGWLLCDGTLYNKNDYTDLSNIIGINFGGNTTTFNVPDLRNRTIVGASSSGVSESSRETSRTIYQSGGSQQIGLSINNIPNHSHNLSGNTQNHKHEIGEHNHTIQDHEHTTIEESHQHNINFTHEINSGEYHEINTQHSHQITHKHNFNEHTHNWAAGESNNQYEQNIASGQEGSDEVSIRHKEGEQDGKNKEGSQDFDKIANIGNFHEMWQEMQGPHALPNKTSSLSNSGSNSLSSSGENTTSSGEIQGGNIVIAQNTSFNTVNLVGTESDTTQNIQGSSDCSGVTSITTSNGNSTPLHNNDSPFLVLNFIIKT